MFGQQKHYHPFTPYQIMFLLRFWLLIKFYANLHAKSIEGLNIERVIDTFYENLHAKKINSLKMWI